MHSQSQTTCTFPLTKCSIGHGEAMKGDRTTNQKAWITNQDDWITYQEDWVTNKEDWITDQEDRVTNQKDWLTSCRSITQLRTYLNNFESWNTRTYTLLDIRPLFLNLHTLIANPKLPGIMLPLSTQNFKTLKLNHYVMHDVKNQLYVIKNQMYVMRDVKSQMYLLKIKCISCATLKTNCVIKNQMYVMRDVKK